MTAPFDISSIVPSKWKSWIGLIGSTLTLVVPYVLELEKFFPSGVNLGIGAVIAVLTALGIYHAPYAPAGTTLAPDTPAVAEAAATGVAPSAPPRPVSGDFQDPWK